MTMRRRKKSSSGGNDNFDKKRWEEKMAAWKSRSMLRSKNVYKDS